MAKSLDSSNGHRVPAPCDTRPLFAEIFFDIGGARHFCFDDLRPSDRVPFITDDLLTDWRTVESTSRGGKDSKAHELLTSGMAAEECIRDEVILVILVDVYRKGLGNQRFRLCVFDKHSTSEDTLYILKVNNVFISAVYIGTPTTRLNGFLKRLLPSRYERMHQMQK
jgi:hypothetical protein